MRIIASFFVLLFPALILSAHIEWKAMAKIDDSFSSQVLSLTSPNGATHFFWKVRKNLSSSHIWHRRISADGMLADKKLVSGPITAAASRKGFSGDISDDGQYLLFIFQSGTSRGGNSYFTESFNGGENWTEPSKVVGKDEKRDDPVVLLEKDTGRAYVAYNVGDAIRMAVKEPGAQEFTQETIIHEYKSKVTKHLTQVVDKIVSRRVFHMFTSVAIEDSLYVNIDHFKSLDGITTWTNPRTIASNVPEEHKIPVAVGTKGHFYVQYRPRSISSTNVLWTKDHGETWESPIVVTKNGNSNHKIAMCGKGSDERVISVDGKDKFRPGYIKYLKPGQTEFKDLNYPLPAIEQIMDIDVSCACNENGKCTVALILASFPSSGLYIAYGTAHNL